MKTFISSSILILSVALVASGSPLSSSDAASSSATAAAAGATRPVPLDNQKYRVTKTLTSTTTIHNTPTRSAYPPTATGGGSSQTRNVLPVASPAFLPEFDEPDFGPYEDGIPTGPISRDTEFDLAEYPPLMTVPDTGHEGVQAAIEAIDWDHVPDIPVRTLDNAGEIDTTEYDVDKDEACWWSATLCLKPKIDYVPEDIHICSKAGEWGLTFDDGPLNPRKDLKLEDDQVDPYAEPRLYDFLAKTKQKATLFYVGSNVVTYPDAAKRAFQSGHGICLHTWSHSAMTTLTNEQVVAELYWALRAVKHATGVTSRCWRPPYGDVDDRVRAIAHQMGLTTVLWDYDSEDWKLPSSAGNGMIKPEVVDGYFTKWIEKRKSGNDTEHGHITLQHEINEATVGMAEKWLPRIQGVFNVKPLNECTSMKQLYWEQEIEDEKDEKDYDHDDGHDDDDDHDNDDDHHKDDDDDYDDDDGDDDYE